MDILPLLENFLPGLAAAASLGAILGTMAGFLGQKNWVLDLFSHFRPQYFWLLLLTSITLIMYGQYTLAAVSGIFALLNLVLILPCYYPRQRFPKEGDDEGKNKPYRIVSINVLQENQDYARAASYIKEVQPDVLLLVEVNSSWLAELEPALDSLPFSIQEPREDNYGIALFSRFPILEGSVVGLISREMPSICARIALKEFKLTVLGTHPSPPKSRKQSEQRNLQLEKMAKLAASINGPHIVMGDLNLTVWSPYYRDFMVGSGLKDSRRGFGIQATWPVKRPHLWVPIDHILVSSHLQVHRFKKGAFIGSDHFPILCDITLEP